MAPAMLFSVGQAMPLLEARSLGACGGVVDIHSLMADMVMTALGRTALGWVSLVLLRVVKHPFV